jgi:hypothetical protein
MFVELQNPNNQLKNGKIGLETTYPFYEIKRIRHERFASK